MLPQIKLEEVRPAIDTPEKPKINAKIEYSTAVEEEEGGNKNMYKMYAEKLSKTGKHTLYTPNLTVTPL